MSDDDEVNPQSSSRAAQSTLRKTATTFGLTLSGGGFRATLFHLGVIKLLHRAGFLSSDSVKSIGSVSGGSILAAHLVLNWEKYTGDDSQFDSISRELIDLAQADVRGWIVRRRLAALPLAAIAIPRLITRRTFTFTDLLERRYSKLLYHDARLTDFHPAGKNRPKIQLFCTSLSSGDVCSFWSRSHGECGFTVHSDYPTVYRHVTNVSPPVAFAVAGSSAFPPLFAPITVSHRVLKCDAAEFPDPHRLSDGGVYDNLGVSRMILHLRESDSAAPHSVDQFLVSDAEGGFDADFDRRFSFVVTRNVRASLLLMKRVTELQYKALRRLEPAPVEIRIRDHINPKDDVAAFLPEVQRAIGNIRTDLDAFSPIAVRHLFQHGYSMARSALVGEGLIARDAVDPYARLSSHGRRARSSPSRPADEPKRAKQELAHLEGCKYRKLHIWSWKDWASWWTLGAAVLLAVLAATAVQSFIQAFDLGFEAGLNSGDLISAAQQHNQGYQRPLHLGLSASVDDYLVRQFRSAGTICCAVSPASNPRKQQIIGRFGTVHKPEPGTPIYQPGPADSSDHPYQLATLGTLEETKGDTRWSSQPIAHYVDALYARDAGGEPQMVAEVADLSDGQTVAQVINGIGPICGLRKDPVPGQIVQVSGRKTGIVRATIRSIVLIDLVLPQSQGVPKVIKAKSLLLQTKGSFRVADLGAPVTLDGKFVGMVWHLDEEHASAIRMQDLMDALDVQPRENQCSRIPGQSSEGAESPSGEEFFFGFWMSRFRSVGQQFDRWLNEVVRALPWRPSRTAESS